jgi:chromosome segregation protein
LHREKIELLNRQAEQFTQLSKGIIKAEVTRNINIDLIQEQLIQSLTGTRISKDKIELVCEQIRRNEQPLETWNMKHE